MQNFNLQSIFWFVNILFSSVVPIMSFIVLFFPFLGSCIAFRCHLCLLPFNLEQLISFPLVLMLRVFVKNRVLHPSILWFSCYGYLWKIEGCIPLSEILQSTLMIQWSVCVCLESCMADIGPYWVSHLENHGFHVALVRDDNSEHMFKILCYFPMTSFFFFFP